MLMGRYEYTLDAKNRANFPPKFKAELGEELYLAKWFDDCLIVVGRAEWMNLTDKIAKLNTIDAKKMYRLILGSVTEVATDKQGRILIPQYLKSHAGLEKDILVLGTRNYAEIWDKTRFEEYEQNNGFASMEEKLAELEF